MQSLIQRSWQMPNANLLSWLLEKDAQNPGVRYFALRDLVRLPNSDPEVGKARSAIMRSGQVPIILEAQQASGAWAKPGSGYSPKYRATSWSLLILAELGADPADPAIRRGCEYLLSHSPAQNGAFSAYQKPVPSGAVHCLNGNMLFALQRLGFGSHPVVQQARKWLAHSITGREPIAYYASAVSGPGFACGVNGGQPCAWGANKAIRALLETPPQARTPAVKKALKAGAQFLLSRDPVIADYPFTGRVSSTWFKLGFPLSYWSDVLETLSNLVALGYGKDRRLRPGLQWLADKQDANGQWKLGNTLNGKMWADIEAKGKPSKWVTLRALRLLKNVGLYKPGA
jgi:hypothetical protein